ncbi:MAG: hypothetical protein H7838_07200 [Magnetococcus sp. DMHC-8]
MTPNKPVTTPDPPPEKTEPHQGNKPFTNRMQRLLAGQPNDDVILDPDNPNLILEKRQESTGQ